MTIPKPTRSRALPIWRGVRSLQVEPSERSFCRARGSASRRRFSGQPSLELDDEARDCFGDLLGCATGRVDRRQTERPIAGCICDGLVDGVGFGMIGKPLASLFVVAIEQDPGIDRPSIEFSRSTHAEQDAWCGHYEFDNQTNETTVRRPSPRTTSDIASSQFTCGGHERIPIEDDMVRQLIRQRTCDRALARSGRSQQIRQHRSAPYRRAVCVTGDQSQARARGADRRGHGCVILSARSVRVMTLPRASARRVVSGCEGEFSVVLVPDPAAGSCGAATGVVGRLLFRRRASGGVGSPQ